MDAIILLTLQSIQLNLKFQVVKIIRSVKKNKSVKRSTKIELYERIIMAKQIMRDNRNNAINLK